MKENFNLSHIETVVHVRYRSRKNMVVKKSFSIILLAACIYGSNASVLPIRRSYSDLHRKIDRIPETFLSMEQNGTGETPIEPPFLVGSFNIQTLGKKKFVNLDIMDTIEKVILRYDLMLLTELMEDKYIWKLLKDLNYLAPDGTAYDMRLSETNNATKEHYAIFYRTNKLKMINEHSYTDSTIFFRRPFIVIFEAFTLRDMKKFGVIGHHVKPDRAVAEIDALADLYDFVTMEYEIEDVLLMGDFNADCDYVKEKHWEDIALWTRSEFTWAITNNMDTTTNYRSCALDRFVYAGENMNSGVILSSAGIFNFQEEYGLSVDETRKVSDHWPIELRIRGKMSDIAEKHLHADVCFKIRDSQRKNDVTTQTIIKLAKNSSFDAIKTVDGIVLSNRTREEEDMLNAMRELSVALPEVLSHELEEAVKYKVKHGSLQDDSSFADVFEPGYRINVTASREFTEVSICRTTSVN